MVYIKSYWENKESRATQAKNHTKEMQMKYQQLINDCIMNTKIYDCDFVCYQTTMCKHTEIIVEDLDTVSTGEKYVTNGKVALLNFASYKNPGGQFINGSKAQEECLCHASYLYNVLVKFKDTFYHWNNQHKNKALYLNRGLYSPDVMFKNNSEFSCDVITCAAPNKSAAQKYLNVTDSENTRVLQSRIKFVLDIAKENNVDTLILGAYGCGVFGQDPEEVASIFKEYLHTTHKNCFNKVVFAIPNGRDGNLISFKNVFKETKE